MVLVHLRKLLLATLDVHLEQLRDRLRSHAQPFGVDPLLAEGWQQPDRRPSPASALP
jgi:hypothetical protein